MALGHYLRQERERTIVRAVTDADQATGKFVYRPSGSGQTLYASDGSQPELHRRPANTTSPGFNAAVPLMDWTDIDTALQSYRATEVKDDRIDGEPRADRHAGQADTGPGGFARNGAVDREFDGRDRRYGRSGNAVRQPGEKPGRSAEFSVHR